LYKLSCFLFFQFYVNHVLTLLYLYHNVKQFVTDHTLDYPFSC